MHWTVVLLWIWLLWAPCTYGYIDAEMHTHQAYSWMNFQSEHLCRAKIIAGVLRSPPEVPSWGIVTTPWYYCSIRTPLGKTNLCPLLFYGILCPGVLGEYSYLRTNIYGVLMCWVLTSIGMHIMLEHTKQFTHLTACSQPLWGRYYNNFTQESWGRSVMCFKYDLN